MIFVSLLLVSAAVAVDIMGNLVNYPNVTVDQNVERYVSDSTLTCESGSVERSAACEAIAACSGKFALAVIDPLKTEFPTSLVPGRVAGTNTLEIVVQHPSVVSRVVKSIVLNASASECNYPGANWYHGVDSTSQATCRDVYVSSVPWPIAASRCGMTRSENATHVLFDGVGTVNYEDALPLIDNVSPGPRSVSSVVRFQLAQPKVIRDITTAVTTLDDPRILSAITRQQYDFASNTATLAVVLSLAAPLRVATLYNWTAPAGIALTPLGVANSAVCGDAFNATCQQTFAATLDPGVLCQLDGAYAFTFNVACHPSVANTAQCPLADVARPLSIAVTLDSEDLCAVVAQLLAVRGNLTSHGTFDAPTFTFGAEKTAFFQEQSVHFQAKVDSLNGFPYASSRLLSVALEDKTATRLTIYNASADGAAAGWTFAFDANASSGATTHRHHFTYTPAIDVFGDVERNNPITSRVFVDVEIQFVNTVGGARKRTLTFEVDALDASEAATAAHIAHRLRQAATTTPRGLVAAQVAGQVVVQRNPALPDATTAKPAPAATDKATDKATAKNEPPATAALHGLDSAASSTTTAASALALAVVATLLL